MESMYRVTFRPKGSTSKWWDVAHDGLTEAGARSVLAQRSVLAAAVEREYRIEALDKSGAWVAVEA